VTNTTLTHSQKRRIRKRILRRADRVEERLRDVSEGRTIPNKRNQRLNEPRQYELAMVFIDIDGFSQYVFDNNDKEVLYMLGVFIPEAMKLVREYNGYFEKNTGDGLLAYFGFGEDPTTSISNLLAYLSTVRWALSKEINPLLKEYDLSPISISGGATFGRTYLSRLGERDMEQELNRLTGVSTVANIASRLEERADEEEFLVGPNIWYHSDPDSFRQFLKPHSIFSKYTWRNPETDENEPYQIYEFQGGWEGIDVSSTVAEE